MCVSALDTGVGRQVMGNCLASKVIQSLGFQDVPSEFIAVTTPLGGCLMVNSESPTTWAQVRPCTSTVFLAHMPIIPSSSGRRRTNKPRLYWSLHEDSG